MTLRKLTLSAVAVLSLGTEMASAQTAATDVPAPPVAVPATEAPAEVQAGTAPAKAPVADVAAEPAVAPAAPVAEAPAETASDPAAGTAPADAAPGSGAPAETAAPASDAVAPTGEAGVAANAATAAEQQAPAAGAAPATGAAAVTADAPVAVVTAGSGEAQAAHGATAGADDQADGHGTADAGGHVEDITFSFEGPFGAYDQFQLQRGLQVYTEVCAGCHGMKQVPIRTLADAGGPGLPENQVRAYAANLPAIVDAETGEERAREWTDHFPAVQGEGMGPDLSLMAKARAGFHGPYGTGLAQLFKGIGGPEYIHALLVDYTGETVEQAGTTLYVNTAFPGGLIAMPPPLAEGQVTYEDGTEATVDQMARDVAAFLMWTAEPKMMDRKSVGLVAVLFLIVLSVLLYLTNKRLWWPHKHTAQPADQRAVVRPVTTTTTPLRPGDTRH